MGLACNGYVGFGQCVLMMMKHYMFRITVFNQQLNFDLDHMLSEVHPVLVNIHTLNLIHSNALSFTFNL